MVDGLHVPEHALYVKRGGLRWGDPLGRVEPSVFDDYDISYADIYDFSSKKQGLKKLEIELGLHHMELGIPWDDPVDESLWELIMDYCANDVIATEATFHARRADFIAREILAELSGLSVNARTQRHTGRIIFGNDKKPQTQCIYTNLPEMFPGCKFDFGKSTYRGEDVGEGGYVYAEPGVYTNVALLDVASMHPASIENLEAFGPYTAKFSELKAARIAINNVYGLTSAKINNVCIPDKESNE